MRSFYLFVLQVAAESTCLLDKVCHARQNVAFLHLFQLPSDTFDSETLQSIVLKALELSHPLHVGLMAYLLAVIC